MWLNLLLICLSSRWEWRSLLSWVEICRKIEKVLFLFTIFAVTNFSCGIQHSFPSLARQHFRTHRTSSRLPVNSSSVNSTSCCYCKLAPPVQRPFSKITFLSSPDLSQLSRSVKLSCWRRPTVTSSISSARIHSNFVRMSISNRKLSMDSPNRRKNSQFPAPDLQWNFTQKLPMIWRFHRWFFTVTCRKVTTSWTHSSCANESTNISKFCLKPTSCKWKCQFHGNFSSVVMWHVKFIDLNLQ